MTTEDLFFDKPKMDNNSGKFINIDEGKLTIGIKTYIIQFIGTVSLTITICSIYYGIIIEDLKTQLNTTQLEKNQMLISRKMDSTGFVRSNQLQELQEQMQQIIEDNNRLKKKLNVR